MDKGNVLLVAISESFAIRVSSNYLVAFFPTELKKLNAKMALNIVFQIW